MNCSIERVLTLSVRGTGGTHHGPARLVPRGRLPRVAFVMLRFAHRKTITGDRGIQYAETPLCTDVP